MFCARTEEEAYLQARDQLGTDVTLEQDPDVLDTWFSSGLWPFSTLGWPEQTADLAYYYPTAILETGYDILFFWVARMIMSGLEFTGEIPFHTVYLHGLVRDEKGRKMSKTTGNVIDPLVVMDELGTDALRFTLLVGSTPGKDTNLSVKKVESNRNFANKIWNAGRLILSMIKECPEAPQADPEWTLADGWIWARVNELIERVDRLFESYQYGEAGRQIYDFFWSEFADWYLEIAKLQLKSGGDRAFYTVDLALRVYDYCLRMLHPFTPFVTEEMWQRLKSAAQHRSPKLIPERGPWETALIAADWPTAGAAQGWEADCIISFDRMREVIRSIRNARAEMNVKPGQRIAAVMASTPEIAHELGHETTMLANLAGIDENQLTIEATESGHHEKPADHIALVAGPIEIFLPLADIVDPEAEQARLRNELQEAEGQIVRLEKLLGGAFAQKAPEQIVAAEREKLAGFKDKTTKLRSQLEA